MSVYVELVKLGVHVWKLSVQILLIFLIKYYIEFKKSKKIKKFVFVDAVIYDFRLSTP